MKRTIGLVKRISGGVLVGVSLAIALAMPAAQAAPPYGSPESFESWRFDPDTARRIRQCSDLTNYQLRQRVSKAGYVHIYLGGDIGTSGNVEVKGTLNGHVYLLEVDKCSGKIEASILLHD